MSRMAKVKFWQYILGDRQKPDIEDANRIYRDKMRSDEIFRNLKVYDVMETLNANLSRTLGWKLQAHKAGPIAEEILEALFGEI